MIYKLQELFNHYNIQNICCDSRNVTEKSAFFAIKGEKYNGNNFINDAIKAGAKLIITDDPNINCTIQSLYVDDARIALSIGANIIYDEKPKHLIGVTGTNGKTSVVSYIRQLYKLLGKTSASIGTIGIESDINSSSVTNSEILTTPNPINFGKILSHLAKHNIEYLAFESSSHGLDQQRLHGINVKVACFTSFSQDHLDYHQNMEKYLLAKLKLFKDNLSQDGLAIINAEIKEILYIKNFLNQHNKKFVTIGDDVKILNINSSIDGQNINFSFQDKEYDFYTKIIGSFQATNLLIAMMVIHNSGFTIEEIINQLPNVKAVKGRLDAISNINQNFHIFIDYAHTPDALEKTLLELKQLKFSGKLRLIFGCGGNRDITKRAIMGQIATQYADEIIITDDNPRDENPEIIRSQIIEAFNDNQIYKNIGDRREAIEYAISKMQNNDILLIAGKGHEESQIIGNKKIYFSDHDVVKKSLCKLKIIK
jgi:UDP-N-acetylmuramoyl-L-alanyl-D-glutamate--2,6-diaminopimelate ligase